MIVTHFMRRPPGGAHSMERIFANIRTHLPADIHVRRSVCRFASRGLFRRTYDMVRACFHQGEVNHITGDVHFLTTLLPRRRTLLTIHDCVTLRGRRGLSRWILWFLWFWLPVRRCARVSVVSESTRRQLIDLTGCDPAKVCVVHNPISADFTPAPKAFDAACPRILHVGTKPNKNLERHVEALAGVPCVLVVVGRLTVAQRRLLEAHRVAYENLVDLPSTAIVEQYIRSDLLLFASTYEGFGLPIVEAQAVGRPVVTADAWSMPEAAGGAACLVDPLDVASIRAGVSRVIADVPYREALVAAGFANIDRFGARTIAHQYAAIYRQIHRSAGGGHERP